MTKEEFTKAVNFMVDNNDTVSKTKDICYKCIDWIEKRGGNRSRGEGVKLLNRIIKRLNERPIELGDI